ncbi:hypothetical protein LB467_09900 [Salegentibacter sp. JZCK2]|uniref:hypothetical protein n=1 Tax=Salegentibacter tibetensis TaxID=2873600 RepID=UPI001CCEE0A3|nr:hypothetical protein [Salegentibacter tibetensis]MBZ9729998.1 hypothetical protein [Salegentibacter tibetensis]
MRKLIISAFVGLFFISCGSVKRTMFGTTEKTLIKTVSVEQGCEKENIEIIDSVKGLHGATYSLDVCGDRMVYKEVGSVFMEASVADKKVEELTN